MQYFKCAGFHSMAVHELNRIIIRSFRVVLRQARFKTNGPLRLHCFRTNFYLAVDFPVQRTRNCIAIRIQHPPFRSEPDNLFSFSPWRRPFDIERILSIHSDIHDKKRLPLLGICLIRTAHRLR